MKTEKSSAENKWQQTQFNGKKWGNREKAN